MTDAVWPPEAREAVVNAFCPGCEGVRNNCTAVNCWAHQRTDAALAALAPFFAAARAAGVREGMEKAAEVLRKKARDYHQEHGLYDSSTGVTEYPGDGDAWMEDWEETADAIMALIPRGREGEKV
jgi:hypothetical protein